MASLFERLLGDDTPDEQANLEAHQERADDALRERVALALCNNRAVGQMQFIT